MTGERGENPIVVKMLQRASAGRKFRSICQLVELISREFRIASDKGTVRDIPFFFGPINYVPQSARRSSATLLQCQTQRGAAPLARRRGSRNLFQLTKRVGNSSATTSLLSQQLPHFRNVHTTSLLTKHVVRQQNFKSERLYLSRNL